MIDLTFSRCALTRSNGVHGTGLQVDQDGPGDVFAAGGLVEVDIDPLELKIRVSVVGTGGVDTVLIGDNLGRGGLETGLRRQT